MDDKFIFGIFVISIVAAMQLIAWYTGLNGTIFAFTSLVIGLVAGKLLDFSFKKSG